MRWLIRAMTALILALGVGFAGLLLLPQERIAHIAADQIYAQTGRRVEISPPLSLSFWPVLGVDTGPVQLANAPWAGSDPMLEAKGLSIGLAAPDLLRGEIRVIHVVARAPVLRLEQDETGRGNWDFNAADAPVETTQSSLPALERFELQNARLIHKTAGSAETLDLSDVDLVMDWPDPQGVAHIAVTLPYRGTRLGISATSPELPKLLQGAVARVTAEVTAPGSRLRFVGRATTSGEAAGRITLEAKETAPLATLIGLETGELPAGIARNAALRADVTYTSDGRLSLRGLDLALGGNRLSGAADVTLSGKPTFNARLNGETLDLRGIASAPARAPAPGWSDAPIDASALSLADGTLALTAGAILLPQTTLGRTETLLTIDRARAVLRFSRLDVFDGQITGQLVANNRNGLSVGGKLQATGIELARLLIDMAHVERFSGAASGQFEFLGIGQSQARIMASLSGRGGIDIVRGRISGFDLDALMAGEGGAQGTTVFDHLSASFAIKDGTLSNDDLEMSLPNFRVTGTGHIGLFAQDLDYRLTPTALRPRGGQGLSLPIRIRGPWADPSISPEIENLFKDQIDSKLESVRAEAKSQVQHKLSEELETHVADENELKDAAKSRLKDKARGGLLKLLERN